MYFSVKYIDLKTFEKTKDVDPLNTELDEDVKKSLAAKNKNLAVNPDCFVAIIMDYIFENVGIDDDNKATFDMITRNGKQLNVQSYAPDYSGLNVFDDREEYYVAYHDDEKIKPLLSKTSQEYLDFTENRKKKTISSRKSKDNAYITKASSSKGKAV